LVVVTDPHQLLATLKDAVEDGVLHGADVLRFVNNQRLPAPPRPVAERWGAVQGQQRVAERLVKVRPAELLT
jgi:hypothetical protein